MHDAAQVNNDDRRVSVIIPAYNAEHFLREAIDSALSQTLPAYEILVINDGSTDRTRAVAESYGDRITYIEQQNQGQGAARNAGLAKASGRFIAFLDADDFWQPEFLEKCVNFLHAHEEAVAVLTAYEIIDLDGSRRQVPPTMHASQERPRQPFVIPNFFRHWYEHGFIQTGAIVLRSDVCAAAGMQRDDLRVSQDLEYWALISTFGSWGFIPERLFVSNSRINSVVGWRQKYRRRRRDCPTTDSWRSRVAPRVPEDAAADFERICGKVAAAFAHTQILGGNDARAREEFRRYRQFMPQNPVTRLLAYAAALGAPGWFVACRIIRLRELMKSVAMPRSAAAAKA